MCDVPGNFYRRDLASRKTTMERWAGRRAIAAVEVWQAAAVRRIPVTVVISEAEKKALGDVATEGDVRVISNGIDADYFSPDATPTERGCFVFVGVMDFRPNRDAALHFADEILPKIAERDPAARFIAVGKGADAELLGRNSRPGIEFTGEVDDVRPWVRRAEAFVCPIRYGAGLKNKILVAMAMRVPVVCSRLSLEGIDAIPGEHVLVADTPEEYVEAIAALRGSPELRASIVENANCLVLDRYAWNSKRRELNDIIETVARRSRADEVRV